MTRVTLNVRAVGDPEPDAIDQTPRRMLALHGGGQVWPREEDVVSVENVPDGGALDALLAAEAAGALPVTGFMDRDGDLWLWSAATERWECYPTPADPTLHEADTARLARSYGPLRSIVIHPTEETPNA